MEIYAFNLSDEVKEIFNATKLMEVAQARKSSRNNSWYNWRNKNAATHLFSDVQVIPAGPDQYELWRIIPSLKAGQEPTLAPKGLMERTDQGGAWRFYNKLDKEQATQIILLVEGEADYDLYHENPGVRIEESNGIYTLHNITQLNEVHYSEVKFNTDISSLGCLWFVRGARDGQYIHGKFIANKTESGTVIDWNRGKGTRMQFVKITERDDVMETVDMKGDTDLLTDSADYIYTDLDRLDPDKETIAMITYHGMKQTTRGLFINLEDIFNSKK